VIAITIDLEAWYHVPVITGSPFARYGTVDQFFQSWTGRYDYLTRPTLKVLDLLDEFGITATFFVVADIIGHYPGLVQAIAARGHEIACHGLHHECKIHPKTKQPTMSRGEFLRRTARAKDVLQQTTGHEVIGYRAPAAYIGGWMLPALQELGFLYDSSVAANSFYNKTDSRPLVVGTCPYRPAHGRLTPSRDGNGIVELPWPFFKMGLTFPTAGGPMLRLLGAHYLRLGLEQSRRRGHTLLYFHPIDLSREAFPSCGFHWRRPFYWSVRGTPVENRIRWLLRKYASLTGTCSDILHEVAATQVQHLANKPGEPFRPHTRVAVERAEGDT